METSMNLNDTSSMNNNYTGSNYNDILAYQYAMRHSNDNRFQAEYKMSYADKTQLHQQYKAPPLISQFPSAPSNYETWQPSAHMQAFQHQMMQQKMINNDVNSTYASIAPNIMQTQWMQLNSDVAFVNPKQYRRILQRRVAREKFKKAMSNPNRAKRVFVHLSRHEVAKKRPRGPGGRFLTKSQIEQMQNTQSEINNNIDPLTVDQKNKNNNNNDENTSNVLNIGMVSTNSSTSTSFNSVLSRSSDISVSSQDLPNIETPTMSPGLSLVMADEDDDCVSEFLL